MFGVGKNADDCLCDESWDVNVELVAEVEVEGSVVVILTGDVDEVVGIDVDVAVDTGEVEVDKGAVIVGIGDEEGVGRLGVFDGERVERFCWGSVGEISW